MTDFVKHTDAAKCIKCGFCMSACPVYQEDHVESHVARGRNVLIRLAESNQIQTDAAYSQSLDQCLLCGQCLAVCPAKVPSLDINIEARKKRFQENGPALWQRLVYRGILKHRFFMARLMGIASMIPGLSQKDGRPLRHMADFMSLFSGGIRVPKLSKPFLKKRLKNPVLPPDNMAIKGKVAFFPGCGFDFFFSDIGEITAQALAKSGFEVVYPKNQTCCGMAVHNAGDFETARQIAEKNIAELSGFDHIVTGCATCGSTLKSYGKWFSKDDAIKEKADALSARVYDFSEFLNKQRDVLLKNPNGPVKVTYHAPCHLKWHQGVSDFPRQILNSLEGVDFIEMQGADTCCGLGGTFGITHRDMSLSIQEKKIASIQKTGAQTVVTACPGCMIQLMDGLRRHGLDVEVKHISQMIEK